ncbi:hypothetical protein ACLOJK_024598 [Asimina triloba]
MDNKNAEASREVDDEREFDYIQGSEKRPEKWGDIHEEWAMCKNGTVQSAIDLLNERVELMPKLGRLKRNYKPSNAILKNRGHDIMLKWVDGLGSLDVDGIEYKLLHCHRHSPSEYTINGEKVMDGKLAIGNCRHGLEVHMVHESSDSGTAVVGIM